MYWINRERILPFFFKSGNYKLSPSPGCRVGCASRLHGSINNRRCNIDINQVGMVITRNIFREKGNGNGNGMPLPLLDVFITSTTTCSARCKLTELTMLMTNYFFTRDVSGKRSYRLVYKLCRSVSK